MKTMFLRAGMALFALSANAAGLLDNYSTGFAHKIDTKEASGVAYNWDTRTLMVTNDEEEEDGSTFGASTSSTAPRPTPSFYEVACHWVRRNAIPRADLCR